MPAIRAATGPMWGMRFMGTFWLRRPSMFQAPSAVGRDARAAGSAEHAPGQVPGETLGPAAPRAGFVLRSGAASGDVNAPQGAPETSQRGLEQLGLERAGILAAGEDRLLERLPLGIGDFCAMNQHGERPLRSLSKVQRGRTAPNYQGIR